MTRIRFNKSADLLTEIDAVDFSCGIIIILAAISGGLDIDASGIV